jgi:hypothetical protein
MTPTEQHDLAAALRAVVVRYAQHDGVECRP